MEMADAAGIVPPEAPWGSTRALDGLKDVASPPQRGLSPALSRSPRAP
jgi:hypothetical protein